MMEKTAGGSHCCAESIFLYRSLQGNALQFALHIGKSAAFVVHVKVTDRTLHVRTFKLHENFVDFRQGLRVAFRLNGRGGVGQGGNDFDVIGELTRKLNIQAGIKSKILIAAHFNAAHDAAAGLQSGRNVCKRIFQMNGFYAYPFFHFGQTVFCGFSLSGVCAVELKFLREIKGLALVSNTQRIDWIERAEEGNQQMVFNPIIQRLIKRAAI